MTTHLDLETLRYHEKILKDFHDCSICHYQTKSRFSINLHLKRHENCQPPFACSQDLPDYECDNCSFHTNLYLSCHKHKCHETPQSEIKELLLCGNCNFETFSKLIMTKHVLVTCPGKSDLFTERLNGYNDKRREYHKCFKFFVQMRYSDIEWLKCQQCSYMAQMSGNLENHMVDVHHRSKITWSQCEICLFNVEQIFHLRQHLLLEHGENVDGSDE